MASLDGVSFDVTTCSRNISRTILSSVGGFSQSARQNIRSLQDLLATIQRFDLQLFDSRTLQHDGYIGEGVSYKVSRCYDIFSKKLYAKKDVKLPPKSADSGTFERQVACVLRDVEVMYGLANRPNILDIFGYGWDIRSGNVIPFLITELADEGTLRQFLKNNRLALHEKLLLCKDVAHGLNSLHVVGVAHGDLKLDNILVKPYAWVRGAPAEQQRLRPTGMQACISDFGHSLHLYDAEGDTTVTQRYGGTLAYNAPEILQKTSTSRTNLNFRKCDVWSLGLACWEILIDGNAYYHSVEVENSILSSQKRSASMPIASPSNTPAQASSGSLAEDLVIVASQLADISCKEVSESARLIEPRDLSRIHYVFRRCLEPNPAKRIADIPLLPLFYGHGTTSTSPSRIEVRSGTSWSFELFEVAKQIPNEVRKRIASDCEKIAKEPGESIVSARASFQLGLAYLSGFGFAQNTGKALYWFTQSVEKGFRLANLYLPVLRSVDPETFLHLQHDVCLRKHLSSNRAAFRALFDSLLTTVDETTESLDFDSRNLCMEKFSQTCDVDAPVTKGETALTLAAKLGSTCATKTLLTRGANVSLIDSAGCTILHWLFMFPADEIKPLATRIIGHQDGLCKVSGKTYMLDINHLAPINRALVADSQLPTLLGGSPLAFAIVTHCKAAVTALLDLGANPLHGLQVSGFKIQMLSPISIAFRLHMAEILDLLLENVLETSTPIDEFVNILDGLQDCLPALPLERMLIHGPHVEFAAQQTIDVFWKYSRYVGREPRASNLLQSAARSGDLDLCSTIMSNLKWSTAAKLSEKERDELMVTCTYCACEAGRDLAASIKVLHFAIDNGCDINCCSGTYQVPLFIVADHMDVELLNWMLDNLEIDLGVVDAAGNTILHRMIRSGLSLTFDLDKLISKGANPQVLNCQFQIATKLIHNDQDFRSLRVLLQHASTPVRRELLQMAVEANAPKLLTACIESLEENILESSLPQLVLTAAAIASSAVVDVLLKTSVDPNSHHTILHTASRFGKVDVVKLCLEAGYDTNAWNHSNALKLNIHTWNTSGTPLMAATRALTADQFRTDGIRACCDALLDAGADPNYNLENYRTPLVILLHAPRATRAAHFDLIRTLLQKDADPNVGYTCTDWRTAVLPNLIEEVDFELGGLLIKHGICIDQASKSGDYPLHLCARVSGGVETAQFERFVVQLLEAGANPFSKNGKGKTPLEVAIFEDNGPMTFILIRYILANSATRLQLPVSRLALNPSHHRKKPYRQSISKLTRLRSRAKRTILPTFDHISELGDPHLLHAWDQATAQNAYSSIAAFVRTGLYGNIKYLSRRKAITLLYYAISHESAPILRKFMGGWDTHGVFEMPDSYLSGIWGSIRFYFACSLSPDDLLSLPLMIAQGPPEPSKALVHLMDNDPDITDGIHDYSFHRLQYMSAIDEYSPLYPASHLVWCNFVEAQLEPGMIEVVIDEEAEKRKQQHLALKSLLGPIGDEELAYAHLSGV